MQTKHESVLRAINNDGKSYNILTYPCHERYQSNLGCLPHTFYMYQGEGIKHWKSQYAPIPKNHILLDGSPGQIKPDIKFDMVLSQGKHHYEVSKMIAVHFGIPLISIEHTLPYVNYTKKVLDGMKRDMRGDVDIFISKYSINQWGFDEDDPKVRVIEHAIDSEIFNNFDALHNDEHIRVVCNDWINRDWCCNWSAFERIVLKNKMSFKAFGDTPGFSKAAKDTDELIDGYKNASVFLNTSTISPIPMSLLEAMSCGTPCVSTATCQIPDIITDGVNGFCSNNEDYLKDKLIWCLENPTEAKKIGLRARETIVKRFNLKKHLVGWSNVFNEFCGRGHANDSGN